MVENENGQFSSEDFLSNLTTGNLGSFSAEDLNEEGTDPIEPVITDPIEDPIEPEEPENPVDSEEGSDDDNNEGNDNDNNPDEDVETFTAIGDFFKSKGLFDETDFENEDFKFDGTEESFMQMVQNKIQKQAETELDEFVESLPDKIKNPIKAYLEGLDENEAFEIGDKLSFYQNVTRDSLEKDLDKARKIYTDNLLMKGFDKEKAEKYVKRAEDLEELVDEALDSSKEIVDKINKDKQDKAKALEEKQKKDRELAASRVEEFKKDIMSRKELFKGFPTTNKIKEKVIENMTKPYKKDENGKTLTKIQSIAKDNPQDFNLLLNTLEVLGVISVDKDGKLIPKLDKLVTYKKGEIINDEVSKVKDLHKLFKGGRGGNNSINTSDKKGILETLKSAISQE